MDAMLPAGLPRLALLVRLPGLPRPRGAGEARRAARAGADRRRAVRGVPAAPGAVDVARSIVHHPEAKYFNAVTWCAVTPCFRSRPCCSTWTACSSTPSTAGAGRARGDGRARRRPGGPTRTPPSWSAVRWTGRTQHGAAGRLDVAARGGEQLLVTPWHGCSRAGRCTGRVRLSCWTTWPRTACPARWCRRRRGRWWTRCCATSAASTSRDHRRRRGGADEAVPGPLPRGVRAARRRAGADGRAGGQPGRCRRRGGRRVRGGRGAVRGAHRGGAATLVVPSLLALDTESPGRPSRWRPGRRDLNDYSSVFSSNRTRSARCGEHRRTDVGELGDEAVELAGAQHEQLHRRLRGRGRRTNTAVQQGDLAEEVAGAERVDSLAIAVDADVAVEDEEELVGAVGALVQQLLAGRQVDLVGEPPATCWGGRRRSSRENSGTRCRSSSVLASTVSSSHCGRRVAAA